MHVAVCRIDLHIYDSRSLKDRRRTVVSLCERLRTRFPVSVADVGGGDTWQTATIGIAAVSNTEKSAREIIDRAVSFAYQAVLEAEVTSVDTEVFSYEG